MRREAHALAFAFVLVLTLAAIGSGIAARAAESAVVLVYQRFGDADRHPLESVTLAQFEAHLAYLKQGGFSVMPLRDIVAALAAGRPLPERAVAITIDNAFRSAYSEAWPRLKAAGLPFSVFVATDAVDAGGRDAMSWDELRALSAAGIAIESRGASNRPLWRLAADARRADIERGVTRLKTELGHAPALFAYPSGEQSADVRADVRALGFEAAFGLRSGPAHAGEDRFALPRFELNRPYGDVKRFALIAGVLPLPIRDLTPDEPVLTDRQPPIVFTIDAAAGPLDALVCYASRQGRVNHETDADRRVRVALARRLEPGHDNRVNCTLPTAEGRMRWLGLQYVVP